MVHAEVSKLAALALAAGILGGFLVAIHAIRNRGRVFSRDKIKAFLQNGALVLVSLSVSFVAAEVGYRVYLYKLVTDELVKSIETHLIGAWDLDQFDSEIGFHYKPNTTRVNFGGFRDEFHINSFGFVGNDLDPSPYTMSKPPGEYRIAVLGDSFTNSAQGYLRWTDLLQDYLNRSPRWRAQVGGKFTRVLNFGLDGTGLVQWPAVYRFRARLFAPDLVLVNFITTDISRQFIYRGDPGKLAGRSGHAAIRRFVEDHLVDPLPWHELHSEIIAAVTSLFTTADRPFTAAAAYEKYTSYADRPTAIREGISALQQIRCMNANTIVLHDPLMEEMQVREDTLKRYTYGTMTQPFWVGLETEFLAATKAQHIDIVQMVEQNPLPPDPARIHTLYNLPIDTHRSDYGTLLYARWVYRYLLERGASHPEQYVGQLDTRSCKG